jgi:urease accessory protein
VKIFKSIIHLLFLLQITLGSTVAIAHPGHGMDGLLHGFFHPIYGLDHLLTALAIGIWAAQVGKKALVLFPATFLFAMVLGGILEFLGCVLPFTETYILISLAFLGLGLLSSIEISPYFSIPIIASFGIFHGNAHGVEITPGVSAVSYCAGFILATALLHFAGIAFVVFIKKQIKPSQALLAIRALGGMVLVFAGFLWFLIL